MYIKNKTYFPARLIFQNVAPGEGGQIERTAPPVSPSAAPRGEAVIRIAARTSVDGGQAALDKSPKIASIGKPPEAEKQPSQREIFQALLQDPVKAFAKYVYPHLAPQNKAKVDQNRVTVDSKLAQIGKAFSNLQKNDWFNAIMGGVAQEIESGAISATKLFTQWQVLGEALKRNIGKAGFFGKAKALASYAGGDLKTLTQTFFNYDYYVNPTRKYDEKA